MERPNAWKSYDEQELTALEELSSKYRAYLDAGKTERARIGEGELHLICLTRGAENADGELTLGADQCDLLICACKLTGLAEHLFYDKLCAFSVKGFDILLEAAAKMQAEAGIYIVGGEPTEEYLQMQKEKKLHG